MVNKGIFVKSQITNWLDVFTKFFHKFFSVCQCRIWYRWNYLINLLKFVNKDIFDEFCIIHKKKWIDLSDQYVYHNVAGLTYSKIHKNTLLWCYDFQNFMIEVESYFCGYFVISLWATNQQYMDCISANTFRRNYSFLNLTLCSVTFDHSTYIHVQKIFKGGNYSWKYGISKLSYY